MKRAAIMSLPVLVLALVAPPPAAAIDSFFDIFTELSVAGPPYPTQPIITIVGEMINGQFVPQQQHEGSVADIRLNGLPPGEPVFGTLSSHGGGSGGSPPAIDSFFDVFIDLDFSTPDAGRITVPWIATEPAAPHPTQRLLPINPGLPPGSPASFFDVFIEDSFFDIEYRVADGTGYHDLHLHGTSPSGRMSFFDVFVELHDTTPDAGGAVDSFFDVFVDFAIAGVDVCPIPPCDPPPPPDLSMRSNGTRVPDPVAVQPTTWSGIKKLLD